MKEAEYEKLQVGSYIIQKGMFCHVNTSLSHILGYETPEQLVGKSIWNIIHPDDRKLVKLEIQEEETGPVSDRRIIRVFKKDETILWVHMGGYPIIYQGPTGQQRLYDRHNPVYQSRKIPQISPDELLKHHRTN